MTPAGGAQKVSYMVALLTSEALNVLVLLDAEKDSRATKDDLLRAKLIREQNVVFVSEAFEIAPSEADIEDLIDPDVYGALVREAYKTELKGKTLTLNQNVPRIARRFESAFDALGIPFHKTRVTRLFLAKMASEPDKILPNGSAERFEALFKLINERLSKHIERNAKTFL